MPSNYNSMQANLGLMPQVPSPAETAATLSVQASQQLQQAAQTVSVPYGSTAPIAAFGQQFQRQLSQIQQHQSLGMYQAQAFANLYPGSQQYPQHSLPSPLTMTPPSTGVFRPPMAPISASPIPPMATQPMFAGPYTPRLPQPMFQSPWEQNIVQQDLQANQAFAYASQAPRVLGQGAGYGIGAMLGAGLGARFGGMGRIAGAVGGAALSHFSGAAQGLGNMAMLPMQPAMDRHMEAAALGRFSQDWVTTGPQVHALGMGLSRDASLQLASGIRNMAADTGFQRETGGMFNRADLMKITQVAGQSGLMDQSQDVDAIQKNLRQVAGTVRRFMELTNDPDVVSVIREMGRMRQFGFEVPEMERAAMNMRMFARAAGTTVQELKQTGGMSGAMTFQQAGLSAGAGYQYGMYAQGAARQSVATGTYSPMQLSMLGGVQGIAQRDMQAQAAMMSMPLFGASISGFQGGGWGVNHGALAAQLSGQGGAAGMVTGALGNMNQAIQQGGIGALAMFPIQQRFVQAQAAQHVNPQQQMMMRFRMAQQTGETLGLEGQGAFALGAQAMFGRDVGEQMFMQAANPQFWEEQRRTVRRQRDELAYMQRQETMQNDPGWISRQMERLGVVGVGDEVRSALRGIPRFFEGIGSGISDTWGGVQDYVQRARDRKRGVYTRRSRAGSGISSQAELEALQSAAAAGELEDMSRRRGASLTWDPTKGADASLFVDLEEAGGGGFMGGTARDTISFLGPMGLGTVGLAASLADAGFDLGLTEILSGGIKEAQGNFSMMMMGEGTAKAYMSKMMQDNRARMDVFGMVNRAAGRPHATDAKGQRLDEAAGKKGLSAKIRNKVSEKVRAHAEAMRKSGRKFDPSELSKVGKKALMDTLKSEGVGLQQLKGKIKGDVLEDMVGAGISAATQSDPALAADWQKSYEATSGADAGVKDALALASTADISDTITQLEDKLGIEDLSEDQQAAISRMATTSKSSLEFGLRMAIAGGKLNDEMRSKLRSQFNALGDDHRLKKKYSSFDEMELRFMQTATSETSEAFRSGVKEMFEDVKSPEEAQKLVGESQRLRINKMMLKNREAIRKGVEHLMPGDWVTERMEVTDGGPITGKSLVSSLDEAELAEMSKMSGGKEIAKLVKAAQSKDISDDRRKAIERSIDARLARIGAGVGDKKQLASATGEQAEELERTEGSLMDAQVKFAEVFKNFDPKTLSNFKEGSKKLAEAMAEWEVNAPWGTKGG